MDLRPYQTEAAIRIYENDVVLLRCPMGSGKTVSTLTAIADLLADDVIDQAVVLAPKRPATMVWPFEIEKWPHLRHLSCAVAVGTPDQRAVAWKSECDVIVSNYDNLVWAEKEKLFPKGRTLVAFDELTRLKNPMSETAKAWRKIRKRTPPEIVVGLTGTFAANGLRDVHGEMLALDAGVRLGKSKTAFERDYYDRTGPMAWQFEPKPDAETRVAAAIADVVYQIDPSEFLEQMPPFNQVDIRVALPTSAQRAYDEMEAIYITAIDSGDVAAANAGVMRNKLRQISSGFLYDEASEPQWLHSEKTTALVETVEELGQPTLIAYDYVAEMIHAMQALEHRDYDVACLGGGISERDAQGAVERWNAGDLDALLLHPASAGHGLNLQHGGSSIIWLTLPWSWELYEQTRARLPRPGQTASVINEFFIMGAPVDYGVRATLDGKRLTDADLVSALKKERRRG